MGLFSAFSAARKFATEHGGLSGAREGAKEHVRQSKEEWNALHGNQSGIRDYLQSAEGRATARKAVGDTVHRYLRDKQKQNLRQGNYLRGALFSFAHMAIQHQLDALKNDQRIFTNVAKVRRGDPEMTHLTHNELREVSDHAKKYGGQDAEHIEKAAKGELLRRQERKNAEWDAGEKHRDELRMARHATTAPSRAKINQEANAATHAQRMAHEDEAHKAQLRRIAELRTESGHTAAAKIAHEQARVKLRKEAEQAKTKGVQARQTSIRATLKQKGTILKMTKSGGAVMRGEHGGTYNITKDQLQARQKAGSRSPKTPGPKGTRKRRTV